MGGVTRVSKALSLAALLILLLIAPTIDGYQSGKPNTSSGCGGCHGSAGGVTPSLSGLPADYTPGSAYSLTIGGTGTPWGSKGGFSLTANKGIFSNPGTNAKIVSNSPTHSNTNSRSWTVTWTAPSQGSGTANFALAVNFVNGNVAADAGDNWGTMSTNVGEAPVTNNAPTASNVVITPTNPSKATGLTLSYTYADSDSDAESGTEIRWTRDGNLMASFNDLTSVGGGMVTRGQNWSVAVTPSDGVDMGTQVNSTTVTIQNSLPDATNPLVSPSAPLDDADLSATYGFSDLDLDIESGSVIRWYLDGSQVSELDDSTTVINLFTTRGDVWHFTIAPSDGIGVGSMMTSPPVTIMSSNNVPTVSSPAIAPTDPYSADNLQVSWIFDDIDGDWEDDFEVEWSLFGEVQLTHSDDVTLPSSATTKGDVWSFRVRVSDGIDWSNWTSSGSVTVMNSVPVATDLLVNPTNPTSGDFLIVSYDYYDADGDGEAWSTIHWYRDGVRQSLLDDETTIPPTETTRGEVWQAKVTPKDGSSWGDEIASEFFTIENSAPQFATLTIISQGSQTTSLDELVLSMVVSDTDSDPIQSVVSWTRDGYLVPALDGLQTVPTAWLDVGQVWVAKVTLNDGQGGVTTQESAPVTIANLPPAADFTFPNRPMTDSLNPLDGSTSNDPDGEVVGWLWEWHDGEVSHQMEGSSIAIELPLGITNVKLTVFDEHGGSTNVTKVITTAFGPTVSALEAGVSGGEVTLSWGWTEGESEFHIWRMSAPDSGGSSDWTKVATVNDSSWSEPLSFAGESSYRVTAIVDGVENGRSIEGENQVMITLSAEDIPEQVRADISSGAEIFMLILFILATFAALGSASMERFLGGDK